MSSKEYGAGHFYDILHKDKDYKGEVNYIQECFTKYTKGVNNVLDVGCGTGGHSTILHARGIKQLGIDPCPTMINIAKTKPGEYKCINLKNLIPLIEGYDSIISMFYVVNHITSLNGLLEYFKNIYSHLKPGGIFIFDCFNSIAFNRDAPKVLKKESYTITPIIDYFTSKMELIGENTKSPELNYKIEQRIWGIDLILEIINNLNFVNTQIFKQNTYTLVSPDDYKISIVCQK